MTQSYWYGVHTAVPPTEMHVLSWNGRWMRVAVRNRSGFYDPRSHQRINPQPTHWAFIVPPGAELPISEAV